MAGSEACIRTPQPGSSVFSSPGANRTRCSLSKTRAFHRGLSPPGKLWWGWLAGTHPHCVSCGILCVKVLSEATEVPPPGSTSQMRGKQYSDGLAQGQFFFYQVRVGRWDSIRELGTLWVSVCRPGRGLGDTLPPTLLAALFGQGHQMS